MRMGKIDELFDIDK